MEDLPNATSYSPADRDTTYPSSNPRPPRRSSLPTPGRSMMRSTRRRSLMMMPPTNTRTFPTLLPRPLLHPPHNDRHLIINRRLTPRVLDTVLRDKVAGVETARHDADGDLLGAGEGPAGADVRGDGDVAPRVVLAVGEGKAGGVGGGPAAGVGVDFGFLRFGVSVGEDRGKGYSDGEDSRWHPPQYRRSGHWARLGSTAH